MADVRRNEASLTASDWQKLIAAIDATHGMGIPAPRYRDFVQLHVQAMTTMVGMTWRVHTMRQMGMVGVNFLAWHRVYVRALERRLQVVDASVTIPYWDWIANPRMPRQLNRPADRQKWGITRNWSPQFLPTAAQLTAVTALTRFAPFQRGLESLHGNVHIAVGGEDGTGTMAGAASPADPLFWLHHANIDRIWAQWQGAGGGRPSNGSETLQPPPIITGKVSAALNIDRLGYSYA
jgi:tyrosinase